MATFEQDNVVYHEVKSTGVNPVWWIPLAGVLVAIILLMLGRYRRRE